MSESPIEAAEALVAEIRESKSLKERAAYAILHQEQSADAIEDLIAYIRGSELGNAAELKRALDTVSKLLSAIAPLFEQESTAFGRQSEAHQWLSGTAPRLKQAYFEGIEFLKQ